MTASPMRGSAAPGLLELTAEVIERTVEVASVPAPTGDEHRRAQMVAGWWRGDGFDPVWTDEAGNGWARAR